MARALKLGTAWWDLHLGTVYDQVEGKLALGYTFLGERPMKNIVKPVRVYRVVLDPGAVGKTVVEAPAVAHAPRPSGVFHRR